MCEICGCVGRRVLHADIMPRIGAKVKGFRVEALQFAPKLDPRALNAACGSLEIPLISGKAYAQDAPHITTAKMWCFAEAEPEPPEQGGEQLPLVMCSCVFL